MRVFTVLSTKKNHDGLRNSKKLEGSNLEPYESKLRYFDEGNSNQIWEPNPDPNLDPNWG